MPKRPDSADFRQLFLNDTPLLDTRAPTEFAQGAFPNAVNLPLMSDDQRAQVGLCYKRRGQAAAIALGHELVQGAAKAARVQEWADFARRHPEGYLYCFRGGLRSQISQQWLAEAGCDYPRIIGGYKAMRQFLLQALETSLAQGPVIVLSGQTGCAKTQLLQQLINAVDLEGLANHRGSAFGKRVPGQPSQIDFENALSIAFLKRRHAAIARPVVVEDESHLIGRIVLPD
ncbi:MAG: tRNA 2-selenouridine(34) synthase MnmH, partial [Arenimonas sp.]|nr:tRNA 2-selenouridine(34) synthase MnmH [Arenimonas sp.]